MSLAKLKTSVKERERDREEWPIANKQASVIALYVAGAPRRLCNNYNFLSPLSILCLELCAFEAESLSIFTSAVKGGH